MKTRAEVPLVSGETLKIKTPEGAEIEVASTDRGGIQVLINGEVRQHVDPAVQRKIFCVAKHGQQLDWKKGDWLTLSGVRYEVIEVVSELGYYRITIQA